jgi:hypothetical protein
MNGKEYILCAAIHYDDGKGWLHQPKNILTGYVVCGRRHHNAIMLHYGLTGKPTEPNNIQGFVTSKDRFVNRIEGYQIAIDASQIGERKEHDDLDKYFGSEDNQVLTGKRLYSEDIY